MIREFMDCQYISYLISNTGFDIQINYFPLKISTYISQLAYELKLMVCC